MVEYLDTLISGGVIMSLIGVIYKTLSAKVNSKVDRDVCNVVREFEKKEFEGIKEQLSKMWDKMEYNRDIIVREIRKNGGNHD